MAAIPAIALRYPIKKWAVVGGDAGRARLPADRRSFRHGAFLHHVNIHEQGHGFLPTMPEEISMSLMDAVASHFRHDPVAVERFIELLRLYFNQESPDDYLDFMELI